MNFQEGWEKALRETEIIRSRVKPLATFEATRLPYIFLAESQLNVGDTIVRKGEVLVEKPAIILPNHLPQFDGFDFEKEFSSGADFLNTFFMIRGIHFPSLHYNNKVNSLDVFEDQLKKAADHFSADLQRREDIHTGLLIGPEECWQFSVVIFICHQILRQADGDIKKLLDDYRKNQGS